MEQVKVLVVDDYPYLRRGVSTVISSHPGYAVVGEAEDGFKAMEGVARLRPDIVIMDISMPRLDGIQATRRITEEFPGTKVIILSMHTDPLYALRSFKAGAMGYVFKGSDPDELLLAVERVMAGKMYASPQVSEDLLGSFVDMIKVDSHLEPFDSLSLREREILELIAGGAKSREIASRLFISLSTVKTHRINIMRKLGVNDTAGLVKAAIRMGLAGTD